MVSNKLEVVEIKLNGKEVSLEEFSKIYLDKRTARYFKDIFNQEIVKISNSTPRDKAWNTYDMDTITTKAGKYTIVTERIANCTDTTFLVYKFDNKFYRIYQSSMFFNIEEEYQKTMNLFEKILPQIKEDDDELEEIFDRILYLRKNPNSSTNTVEEIRELMTKANTIIGWSNI